MTIPIETRRHAARLDAAPEPRIVLSALPGSGKTLLLRDLGRLWGVPVLPAMPEVPRGRVIVDATGPLPARLPEGAERLVIAGRPGDLGGLSAELMRRDTRVLTSADLFLDPARDPLGWPMVADAVARGLPRPTILRWIREALSASLSPGAMDLLLAACRSGPLDAARLPPEPAAARVELAPLDDHLARDGDPLGALLRAALADLPASSAAVALIERAGDPVRAIHEAAVAGHRRQAVALLERHGGMHLGHLAGPDAAEQVFRAIGEGPEPAVVALGFMVAVKAGDTARAQYLLERWGGRRLVDFTRPVPAGDSVPVALLLARGLLAVYANAADRAARLDELYALLGRLPGDAHLLRGAIHNAALSYHLDVGAFAEAESAAGRALAHYAEAPYLRFYIHLHRAIMRVIEGRAQTAGADLDAARACLAEAPFDAPQDERFLSLLHAVVSYEQGDSRPMAAFARSEFATFSHGEIWPSVADKAMAHGAEALLELSGPAAALDYLDSWRQRGWRTRRYRVLVQQRRVAVLQSAQRWREARLELEGMEGRIGRGWIEGAGEALRDLRVPEDVAQAMLWLRQQVHETPRAPDVARRLAAFAGNPALSWRQLQCVQTWRAWVARRGGDLPRARRLLAETIQACAARNVVAPLVEERVFCTPLLEDRQMQAGPMKDMALPRALRRRPVPPRPRGDLSGQEHRALMLLAEGCSNKEISREMAVSLPTVKFHLANLYRKLGVATRHEAVARALERGFIDT